MKVLFVAHRLPFPPNKGDKIRAHNILRHLTKTCEVHLAALIDDSDDLKHVDDAAAAAKTVAVARIDGPSRIWKALSAILQGRSITEHLFYDGGLQKKIDELQQRHDFDLVFCSSSPTAEYVFRSSTGLAKRDKCVRIMDLIDVDSVKWQQYADDARWPINLIYRREARLLGRYESRIGREFDRVFVVSRTEAELFPDPSCRGMIGAVSNGVDLEYFSPVPEMQDPPIPTLAFVGMMNYRPNIEGMQWFLDKVFPGVRSAVSDCRLLIVGGRPTTVVQGWGRLQGVEVTGFVDDVRDYVRGASLSVVPLLIARGIQNKVLEAMAMGKAVVATPQAIEGIDAIRGEEVVVAADAAAYVQAIVDLLRAPDKAKRIGVAARRRVESSYSWASQLRELDTIVAGSLESSRPQARAHLA